MRKLLPLLSVGIIATAVVSQPVSHDTTLTSSEHSASKVYMFSGNTYKAPNENQRKYSQLARLLQRRYAGTIVKKGIKRTSIPRQPSASLLSVDTDDILPVFAQKDIKPVHQKIANDALKKLPEQCWSTLKKFYVRYDNPKQRGLAGATTMILSGTVSDQEFRALFMHEIGHVFDLNQNSACLGGTMASGISEFKDGKTPMYNDDPSLEFYRISWLNETTQKLAAAPEDFVSGYAAHDVFEDFAESHTLFVLHNSEFRSMALANTALAHKYNFFVNYMYPQGITIADSGYEPSGKRVWDTTKLPYEWL